MPQAEKHTGRLVVVVVSLLGCLHMLGNDALPEVPGILDRLLQLVVVLLETVNA